MKPLLRVAVLGIAAVAATALAAPALASFTPKLTIGHTARAAAPGTVAVELSLAAVDDPPAKIVLYTPLGYVANPSPAVGTQIGTAQAQAVAADLGGATLPLTGTVAVADPNATINYAGADTPLSTLAQSCTGSPTHAAVWLLTLTSGGQQLFVPLFVDSTAGTAEATAAGFKIQICFAPPDVAAGTPGRATLGAKIFDVKLSLTNVFTTPRAPNFYIWRAQFTPYTPAAGTPNTTATVEARAVALIPIKLTLTGKYDPKAKAARLSGTISVAGSGSPGAALPLFAGPSPKLSTLKRSGSTAKADQSGKFTAVRRILKTTYFIVIAGTGGDVTQAGCAEQLPALAVPAPCTRATYVEEVSATSLLKVIVPPPPKKKT
jgi:hypothetical protein